MPDFRAGGGPVSPVTMRVGQMEFVIPGLTVHDQMVIQIVGSLAPLTVLNDRSPFFPEPALTPDRLLDIALQMADAFIAKREARRVADTIFPARAP